jgi:hypothetical protein
MSSRPSRVASSPTSARSHKVAQSKAHIVHVAALTRRRAPRGTHSFAIDNSYGWLMSVAARSTRPRNRAWAVARSYPSTRVADVDELALKPRDLWRRLTQRSSTGKTRAQEERTAASDENVQVVHLLAEAEREDKARRQGVEADNARPEQLAEKSANTYDSAERREALAKSLGADRDQATPPEAAIASTHSKTPKARTPRYIYWVPQGRGFGRWARYDFLALSLMIRGVLSPGSETRVGC